MEKIRLNKYLSQAGICSRREADVIIEDGRVTVNGQKATTGMKVDDGDSVRVDGNPIKRKEEKVVYAYYKPKGVVCTSKDKYAEKTVFDMINTPERVTYAGRLDKDSEGLLVLSNDGDLIEQLMRGSKAHEKEYIVTVNKEITTEFINKMSEGIYLEEINITTRPCKIEKVSKRTFSIILTQGVNRQIRRMCRASGYYVNHLKRVRVANILLADMKIGELRKIEGVELQALYNIAYDKV